MLQSYSIENKAIFLEIAYLTDILQPHIFEPATRQFCPDIISYYIDIPLKIMPSCRIVITNIPFYILSGNYFYIL
jgi:hypothetical protein